LACPIGQQGEERQLRSTVAFAKGVDRIQLGEKMSSFLSKLFRRQPAPLNTFQPSD
jgi:hypothetical protein